MNVNNSHPTTRSTRRRGTVFPTRGRTTSRWRRDRFTGAPRGGSYLLCSWVNDVTPPLARFLPVRVSTGRPTLAVRVLDGGAGVNPYSLLISYAGVTIGASAYDPVSGIALFRLPVEAPPLKAGKRLLIVSASDFQEAKNVNTSGDVLLPNTTVAARRLQVVAGPAVTWLEPSRAVAASSGRRLEVAASAPGRIVSVRFSTEPAARDRGAPPALPRDARGGETPRQARCGPS